jgi:hypothetical protein
MGDGFVARDIEKLECDSCGEVLLSPESLRKIQDQREKVKP